MSEHFYRWLLRFYPSAFRDEYGEEMLQLFRDRISDEQGALARVRLWSDTLLDFAVSVVTQHHRGAGDISSIRPVLPQGMTFYFVQETFPEPRAFAAACCLSTLGLALMLLGLHQSPTNARLRQDDSSESTHASSGTSERPRQRSDGQTAAQAHPSASNTQPAQRDDSEHEASNRDGQTAGPSQNVGDAPSSLLQKVQRQGIGAAEQHSIQDRVVLLGDSTIENWERRDGMFFIDKPYLDRSLARQTTAQMLVRFRQDVVGLNPKTVIIVGGGADLSPVSTPSLRDIEDNLRSMREIANLHHISVILSVSPSFDSSGSKHSRSDERLAKLNEWARNYCLESHCTHLDYYSALSSAKEKFGTRSSSRDKSRIRLMERLTQNAIENAAHEPND